MMLRGARVLARVNDQGDFVKGADGRVEVRYKAGDSKAYRAADRNLEPLGAGDDAILPDDACSTESAAPSSSDARDKRDKKSAAAARVADQKHPESAIIVYADGACSGNPGPAGIGVVVQDGGTRRELSMYIGQGTNNVAELTALMEAAQIIEQPERPVRMHTDSKYAIGVLSLGWKAKANQDLVARVKQALARLEDLKLIHVPGHAGVLLNERADTLAVQAVKSESSTGWVVYEGKTS
jgi:ribonuclease HI